MTKNYSDNLCRMTKNIRITKMIKHYLKNISKNVIRLTKLQELHELREFIPTHLSEFKKNHLKEFIDRDRIFSCY